MPEWRASSWWVSRLPAMFVLGVAGLGTYRCWRATPSDFKFNETLAPNHKRKVLISAGDVGATGFSTFMSAALVDADATSPTNGCRLLSAGTQDYLAAGPIVVKWLDDSRVVLTYSERLDATDLAFRCGGVEIAHVISKPPPAARDAR